MSTVLRPILQPTPGSPPSHNFGMCETFSYIPVEGAGRPLYARASYITNFSDMSIHLSAGELSIGAVTIKDNNTGLNCDVVTDPDNNLNALRVITQDLESIYDDIAIGDKSGLNYATIDGPLSSLNVKVTNLNVLESNTQTQITILSSFQIDFNNQINETQTLIDSLTSLQEDKQNQVITLLHQLTANTDELEINTDGVETLLDSLTSLNQKEFNETQTLLDSLTSLNQKEFNETQTLLDSLTSLQEDKQNQIITLFHQLTANTNNVENLIQYTNILLDSLTSINVSEFNETQTLLDSLTSKDFATSTKQDEQITLLEQLTSIIVSNTVEICTTQTLPVSGFITVINPITSVEVSNPISLKDINNNNVSVTAATSSLNVNVTNPIITTVDPTVGFPVSFAPTTNFDAFGRFRVSTPLTLFDSSHRYQDNNLWCTLTSTGGTTSFNQNQGLIELTVNGEINSTVIRETTKVFAYQPGKSIITMNTFVMSPSATNLRQRLGYYGQDNGIYLQLDDNVISFVKRSLVNGSPYAETIIPLSEWNGDKLDGTGPSKIVLDLTKAQILWTDIEWLGVGTVRCGFVINGQFILCHSFHHANLIYSTYITTASLPLRYEITNKDNTGISHTLKQICSTVISEGGYELRGLQQAISTPIISPATFTSINTFKPIISIRLKTAPDRLDAIAIITALSILGKGNGINYNWQVLANGNTVDGSWISAGENSAVDYNTTGTVHSGGRILTSGFLNSSNQASPNIYLPREALFKFQLERNNLTKTPYEITLVVATDTENGSGIFASMDWEEISR